MKKLLDRVNDPSDLKRIRQEDLNRLAAEIRSYLIDVVSETGGHLSSNLGVVELTIALHYVFDSPYDKLVWDVGHQSYVHKILTGRKEALKTVRQYEGLSGFNKRKESEHDCFDVGHSSTSISGALGYAVGRDIAKEGNSVVAVIGDGALTAGMAYEALNNASRLKSNFIVILNDNQMSIAKNVGGIAQYLDKIRTGSIYNEIKSDVHRVLDKVPYVGQPISRAVKDIKDGIKQMLVPGMFFEEMGYTYLGPIDGHSIAQTITVLKQARKIDGPVLVHLNTVKGKGYHHAEKNPTEFHGVKPFESESGKARKSSGSKKRSYGDILGDKLCAYADAGESIVGITAAMPSGTGLTGFARKHPKQFFDVGIAEQHAVTFSAGLALQGIKPYVAIYSSFLQRAYDQLLHDVCIQNAPAVFLLDRAGVVGEDGETHHGVYDLSYLNHMPNMSVMAPRDGLMLEKMMDYSLTYSEGPLAIRYPKGPAEVLEVNDNAPLEHGRSQILSVGKDIAIVAVGSMVTAAMQAADLMCSEGCEVTVVDAVFIKPVDRDRIISLAETHKIVAVLEENALIGGYGSEVLRVTAECECDSKVLQYGIEDIFIQHGPRQQLLEDCGLTAEKISEDLLKKASDYGIR